jgi:hypothetical protein
LAKDWLEIVRSIEAYYPKAQGAAQNQDENLRAAMSDWGNNVSEEIETLQPWNLSYTTDATTVTTPAQQTYAIPTAFREIDKVFWVDTSGRARNILPATPNQARQLFGTGPIPPDSYPRRYAITGTQLTIWPAPDNNGPTSGNYTITIDGYARVSPMVETTGTTAFASATLSGLAGNPGYLNDNGVPATGVNLLSVRGAGYNKSNTQVDNLLTGWSAIGASTVTMTSNAQQAVTNAQVFFNSTNWIIQRFPKVVLFGVCREVATYLKDDYQGWEQRYQHELELMQGWDARWSTEEIVMFAAMSQQLRPAGRSLYYSPFSWWQGMP